MTLYRIGVDIGGTSVKIGLIDRNLQIVGQSSVPFCRTDAAELVSGLAEAIRALLADNGISEPALSGIGVAVPGSIDAAGETVLDARELGFHQVPLKALLQAQFENLPVFLANRANSATLAELQCGALRGCKTAALLMLETSVDGGLVLNGTGFFGGQGSGIELGHVPLIAGGKPCACGMRGCVEAYCSSAALLQEAVDAAKETPTSMLAAKCGGDWALVDVSMVIDCVKAGDSAAKAVFDTYVDHLVMACLSIVHLLDTERIVIGGEVCQAGELLFEPLRTKVWKKNFFKSQEVIVSTALGDRAGMIGAALLGQA